MKKKRNLSRLFVGPRGAVGGCNNGSRVDPWLSNSFFCPSVPSPGHPRIDEGQSTLPANNDFAFPDTNNSSNNNNPRAPSHYLQRQAQHHHHHVGQERDSNGCYGNINDRGPNNSTPGNTSLGYVDTTTTTRSNVTVGSDPYGVINGYNNSLAPRATSSSHQGRQLVQLLSTPASSSTRNDQSSSDFLTSYISGFPSRGSPTGVKRQQEAIDEQRATSSSSSSPPNAPPSYANTSLLSSLLSNSRNTGAGVKITGYSNRLPRPDNPPIRPNNNNRGGPGVDEPLVIPTSPEATGNLLLGPVKLEYPEAAGPPDLREDHVKVEYILGDTGSDFDDMKYEQPQQGGPHLQDASEPPHSSNNNNNNSPSNNNNNNNNNNSNQSSGLGAIGSSMSVDSVVLSPWNTLVNHDIKQSPDMEEWLLMGNDSEESYTELRAPPSLPSFTNCTANVGCINGINGRHYNTIAVASRTHTGSPTPSTNNDSSPNNNTAASAANLEYYESSVVSSSTPCQPQPSQKHHQQSLHHHHHNNNNNNHHHHHHQQQQQQQHQHHHHNHNHNQHQQHQYQFSQPPSDEYIDQLVNNIMMNSVIADTTVSGSGPSSEQETPDWEEDIHKFLAYPHGPKTEEPSPIVVPSVAGRQYPQQQLYPGGGVHPHIPGASQSMLVDCSSPILQNRLQPSSGARCGEAPTSTSLYTPAGSPPGCVSTSCSPDQPPHSSFVAPSNPRKRPRASGGHHPSKKHAPCASSSLDMGNGPGDGSGPASTTLAFGGAEAGLMTAKERPMHRCSVCSRGFLNKSNIKVHLRTHTGEKPFKCDVCSKCFRQKAHLIKHQQIHRRLGNEQA
ncbi:uncharacterized protein DDB_G0283357 [Copidosoma floridanum]|uniref:uncharacterized protein DDB_G0283357 n=1 Tax=Copidosoma floridanum TaxID=29053 RepID=UPI0006C94D07|nr:uncharacterized protein DDB_G0283357 [Copidosoma floridanum]